METLLSLDPGDEEKKVAMNFIWSRCSGEVEGEQCEGNAGTMMMCGKVSLISLLSLSLSLFSFWVHCLTLISLITIPPLISVEWRDTVGKVSRVDSLRSIRSRRVQQKPSLTPLSLLSLLRPISSSESSVENPQVRMRGASLVV